MNVVDSSGWRKYDLRRCEHSRHKPLCDGAHQREALCKERVLIKYPSLFEGCREQFFHQQV